MIRLRTILTLTSLVQVLVITGVAGLLALRGGQRAVNPLVERLLVEVDQAVHDEVAGLVAEAHQASAVQRMALKTGTIDLHDEEGWRRRLWLAKDIFPAVSYFTIADAKGGFFGLQVAGGYRWAHTIEDRYDTFAVDETGAVGAKVGEALNYSSFERDWYSVPMRTLKEQWTPIYVWAEPPVLSMTLSQPLLGTDGTFEGMVAIDLTLGAIHEFLQRIDVGPNGRAFLLERDGQLVGASSPPVPFAVGDEGKPVRIAATAYEDPVVAAVASHLGDALQSAVPTSMVIPSPNGSMRVRISPLDAEGLDWLLVVAVAEKDVLGDVWAAAYETAAIGGLFVIVAVLGGALVARWVSQPLASLSREVQLIREFKLDNRFAVDTRLVEIAQLKDSLTTMQTGLSSFQRFVPADLVRRILKMGQEATLGGESREVTVLFSDLQGYSTLIERLEPQEVIQFMNAYFEGMEEVIDANGGVVLELLGDAILAVFGAPDVLDNHPSKAAHCAIGMRAALETLNADLPIVLGHRMGVHTGEVVAGNIGGHSYMKYGIIGDVVNVAARLEQLNKTMGTSILISAEVLALAPDLAEQAVDHGEVSLKGRDQPQHVFSL